MEHTQKPDGRSPSERLRRVIRHDLPSSLVVFLVALPLSLGIAIASDAPELAGLIAAVVGGIVGGVLGGSLRTWVGVAGTMTTVAALAHDMTRYDSAAIHLLRVGVDRLLTVCDELIAMPLAQRTALGPMHEGRVDVIDSGAVVIEELAYALRERAGIKKLTVSEHDILDGIALSIAD